MNLIHACCEDRYWSPCPIHDLKVKDMDLEFYVKSFKLKVFRTPIFLNPVMDFIHVWYDDRYLSKILRGTISTLVHDLKVKVMDWEVLCERILMLKLNFESFFVSFCDPLLNLIDFLFGMVIDTGPKFYMVPSRSLCMTLRSRSYT